MSSKTPPDAVRSSAISSQLGSTNEVYEHRGDASSSVPDGGVERETQNSASEIHDMIEVRQPRGPNSSSPNPSMLKAEPEMATATPSRDPRRRARERPPKGSHQQQASVTSNGRFGLASSLQHPPRHPSEDLEERSVNHPHDTFSDRQRREHPMATSTVPIGGAIPDGRSTSQNTTSAIPRSLDRDQPEQPASDNLHESSTPRDQEENNIASGDDQPSDNSSSTVIRSSITAKARMTRSADVEKTTARSTRHTSEDPTRKRRLERIEELEREKEMLIGEEEETEV